MIIKDEADHPFCRGNCIFVADHLSALVENGFEENVRQLGLMHFADPGVYIPPPVGDDDHIYKNVVTTKLLEHSEVPSRYSTHPNIGDPMKVEDTGKRGTSFISAYEGVLREKDTIAVFFFGDRV
jgi:hypothetical protein